MEIITVKNYKEMSHLAAQMLCDQVYEKPNSVLGFATGSTPIGTYDALIEMHKQSEIDFSHITTFNLDEYCGLGHDNTQSYYYFMMDKLFSHVGIKPTQIRFPNGLATDINTECDNYEAQIARAGGIDFQILGVGFNGHIGFNEPDDVFHNNTREVTLAQSTIDNNSRFFKNRTEVPTTAITMGIGSIMAARKIVLLAGADKADIIQQLQNPTVSPNFPVSILHYHPNCTIIYAKE